MVRLDLLLLLSPSNTVVPSPLNLNLLLLPCTADLVLVRLNLLLLLGCLSSSSFLGFIGTLLCPHTLLFLSCSSVIVITPTLLDRHS